MARNYSSVVEPKTLTASVSSSDVQITLNNVTGLPARPYVLVLNPDTVKEEAVLVTVDQTGVTSPTLKVQRAIEASGGLGGAQTHSVGNTVKHMIVGSDLQIVHDHFSNDNTTTGTAHGATGGVVGRTNSQTLTNKTINLTDNTLSGTKAQFNSALSDADFATIAGTETLTGKTINSADNTLTVAQSAVTNLTSDLALKAPLANPTFTGTITGNLTGNVTGNVSGSSGSCTGNAATSSSTTGNAATATALQTARTINGVSFNGTANIKTHTGGEGVFTASTTPMRVTHGLGVTPSAVVVSNRGNSFSANPKIVTSGSVDGTYFYVFAVDAAGNAATASFSWIAIA